MSLYEACKRDCKQPAPAEDPDDLEDWILP